MDKTTFNEKIEKFLKKHNMAAATFGMLANNSPNFVKDIRSGRECREETQRRVLDFMAKYESKYKEEK